MANSVTIYLTSASSAAGNFTIYCQSADPGNEVALNVSSASLAAGYCVDTVCDFYTVKSNTNDCQNQVVVYPNGAPPTPTPGPPTPTPTPIVLPTLTNGWRITAGTVTVSSVPFYGLHRGTLFGCPSTIGYGTGVTPTSTTVNLPGTNCYWTSLLGANIDKGYGVAGIGNVSSYALTMFSLDSSSGTMTAGIINTSGTGNPGPITISGTIVGDNGTSGTWSCNFAVGPTYVDNNGTGTSYTPECLGTLAISGLTITNGVTYNINT